MMSRGIPECKKLVLIVERRNEKYTKMIALKVKNVSTGSKLYIDQFL